MFFLNHPYDDHISTSNVDHTGDSVTFPEQAYNAHADQNHHDSAMDSKESIRNSVSPNTSGHYNLLVIISSPMSELKSRKLLRKYLFGINDNLDSCMKQETNIYYKFLVPPYNKKRNDVLREYTAELIEYNDIIEFQVPAGQSWQRTILEWAQSLDKKRITYNHVVILDVHSIINLEKIQQILDSSLINGHRLNTKRKSNLVWGLFDVQGGDDMFVVLGQKAIATILNENENDVNPIAQAYQHRSKKGSLYFINDHIGMLDWSNSIENIPTETTIAVGHIYQEKEVGDLVVHLNLPATKICYPRTLKEEDKPSIAVVTSSYVYENFCMLPAAVEAADNKRDYALRNGYAFVARSLEFAQQHYKGRKAVWGKIDALEKVLPHYDWLFWIDMDAIIANPAVTIEDLLEKFSGIVGGKENFNDINLIVARPEGDPSINAGVFLMRNSDWSRQFLRDVQKQKNYFNFRMYEQRAMWNMVRKPKYRSGTLLLDNDDHTFNTFPHLYHPGDFVIHFAPDSCPAKPLLKALANLKETEADIHIEIL
ncbi:15198_t:CDS:2 [Acaulospora morrowiae]|uniref:15198_t:CDS:1 n=1 Tax=Acaulospora morrowiae TaxID=94023 RepID=A0A9N9GFC3_9GLOM|nr:15198_t:CDS:2 [Acaulospora morrowiae]